MTSRTMSRRGVDGWSLGAGGARFPRTPPLGNGQGPGRSVHQRVRIGFQHAGERLRESIKF